MRVLLAGGGTGGHLMPALALAQALREARPEVEPVLVGALRGIEAAVLPHHPFRFHLVPIEPIHRRDWWRNLRWPLVAWRSWRAVGRILAAERPAVVIGTGGYAAGPGVLRAQRAGIPTGVQEQNAFPGLTSRWLAGGARHGRRAPARARVIRRPGPRRGAGVLRPHGRRVSRRRSRRVPRGRDDDRGALRLGKTERARAPAIRRRRTSGVQRARTRGRRRRSAVAGGAARRSAACPAGTRARRRPATARVARHPGSGAGAPGRRPGDCVEDFDARRLTRGLFRKFRRFAILAPH